MARNNKPLRPVKVDGKIYPSIGEYCVKVHKLTPKTTPYINMFSKIYKRANSKANKTVEWPKLGDVKAKTKPKASKAPEKAPEVYGKSCTKCKTKKPYDDFYKDKHAKDGHASQCKECKKAAKKAS